jgi:hypothetical protein
MECQSFPIRIFRQVSGGIINAVPRKGRLVGSLRNRVTDFLNDRHSIAPAYFKELIDNYECLIDPLDILRGEATLTIPLIFYEVKIGCSYVAGAAVGYQETEAQEVVDIVYEARSLVLQLGGLVDLLDQNRSP